MRDELLSFSPPSLKIILHHYVKLDQTFTGNLHISQYVILNILGNLLVTEARQKNKIRAKNKHNRLKQVTNQTQWPSKGQGYKSLLYLEHPNFTNFVWDFIWLKQILTVPSERSLVTWSMLRLKGWNLSVWGRGVTDSDSMLFYLLGTEIVLWIGLEQTCGGI